MTAKVAATTWEFADRRALRERGWVGGADADGKADAEADGKADADADGKADAEADAIARDRCIGAGIRCM